MQQCILGEPRYARPLTRHEAPPLHHILTFIADLFIVLSTMTQTNGPSQGHLFDTKDLTPQTGEALEETLALLEEQAKYGAEEGM